MSTQQVTGISSDPAQTFSLTLEDGSSVQFTLVYRVQQLGWFYDLTWGTFVLNGQRLVTGPNMLRQYQNIIPFGLGCVTSDLGEPLNQTDFTSGYATLFLLDSAGVGETEMAYYPGD